MGLTHAEEANVESDVLLAIRELGGWAKLKSLVSWLDGVQEYRDILAALQRMRKRGQVAYRWDGRVQRWGWVEL